MLVSETAKSPFTHFPNSTPQNSPLLTMWSFLTPFHVFINTNTEKNTVVPFHIGGTVTHMCFISSLNNISSRILWWSIVKTWHFHCQGPGFYPWLGIITTFLTGCYYFPLLKMTVMRSLSDLLLHSWWEVKLGLEFWPQSFCEHPLLSHFCCGHPCASCLAGLPQRTLSAVAPEKLDFCLNTS